MPQTIGLIFLLFLSSISLSQSEDPFGDSILVLIENSNHDSTKVNLYQSWSDNIYLSDPEKAQTITELTDSICRKNMNREISPQERKFFEKKWAVMQRFQGEYYRNTADYEKAEEYYNSSLTAFRKLEDKSGEAKALGNIGLVYLDKSDYTTAFDYMNQSLKINEEIQDSLNIASNLLNMGLVFYYQANYDKALGYFKDSYEVSNEMGAKAKAANTLNNIGAIYFQTDVIDSAETYFAKSLVLREELDDKRGMASSNLNLGLIAQRKENFNLAMEYFLKSRDLSEEINDKGALIGVNINIGATYAYREMYAEAIKYTMYAYNDAVEIGDLPDKREAANTLFQVYELKGDYKNAFDYHKIYIQTRDSILDLESQQSVLEQEANLSIAKQHLADSLDFVKQEEINQIAHDKDLENEANFRYVLYGGIAVLLIIGLLILRGYQQKKKDNEIIALQRDEVEKQKAIVELTHQEIRDSIDYAKRIQSAILPNARFINSLLPKSFVFYQPKDVVAGDFYWLEKVGDTTLFAAADCTGHGVPGAMVSVVCHNALNRAVRELKILDPGKILDEVRRMILEEFANSDEEVQDGMDISLCALKGNELKFAGANNPLWLLRNKELIEIKGDKQPVGKFDLAKPFETHDVQLESSDQIYLFSDGLIDQFGGDKGKKFKAKALRELLLENAHKSMAEQKIIIQSSFTKWMGDLEQVDDICLLGIRI